MTNAKPLDLIAVANDAKAAGKYIKDTGNLYIKVSERLHISAVIATYHALQYRNADLLNSMYAFLRVNDQTALRVWIAKHFTVPIEGQEMPAPCFGFSSKEKEKGIARNKDGKPITGFTVAKADLGKDHWALPEIYAFNPFFTKDVKEKDALTLEQLLAMVENMSKKADKAEEEGVKVPADFTNWLKDGLSMATKTKAQIAAISDAPEARSNVVGNGKAVG
jgi:hypothetical protein